MNVEKREKIIVDWINNYCDKASFGPKSLVVGISGGIDSSVVSTLCALTNRKTIVLSMPIKQIKSQHDLSVKHGDWLASKHKNTEYKLILAFSLTIEKPKPALSKRLYLPTGIKTPQK